MTVFTCTLGVTDSLKRPTRVNPAVRYVCLSDRARSVPPYVHVPITRPPSVGDRQVELYARALKILADHPALGTPDLVLWHDAAYRLRCDPEAVAARMEGYDLVAFRHPHRTQIEDEAVAIAQLGYVPAATLTAQAASYRAAGFVQDAISSTGFCLRRTTPAVQAFNRLWWDEVARWGWRDQMSVDFALWKSGLRAGYIPGHYRDNPYAKWSAT